MTVQFGAVRYLPNHTVDRYDRRKDQPPSEVEVMTGFQVTDEDRQTFEPLRLKVPRFEDRVVLFVNREGALRVAEDYSFHSRPVTPQELPLAERLIQLLSKQVDRLNENGYWNARVVQCFEQALGRAKQG